MKKLFLLLLLLASSARAQLSPAANSSGNITTNASNCLTTNACVILHMATSNVGYSVTVSGTWTGTLTVEQSGDNQGSWTTATTTTGNTLYTSALTPGITDVRVRGSAAMTGTAVVTITASGPAVLQQITQTGGAAANSPIPANQAQGPQYNIKNYGAIGDTQHVVDGVTVGSSGHTVTSATANFTTTAKAGQKIVCAAGANATPLMPISTITVVNSATQVTVSGPGDNGAASGLRCIWYTADDTAAWQAATTAATPATIQTDPNSGKTLGLPPGTVYCPPGGYAVSGRIFTFIGNGSSIGPSLMGDSGKNHCIVYMIPGMADPNDGFATLINFYNGIGFRMENISVEGLGFGMNFTHPIVGILSSQQFMLKAVKLTNMATSAGHGTLEFNASANGTTEDVFVQGGATGNDIACAFLNGSSNIINRSISCSNHFKNVLVDATTLRTFAGDNGITFIGGFSDECTPTVDCALVSNSGLANFHDFTFMVGHTGHYALNVDTTSRAYLNNVSCGVFGSTTTQVGCMTIASGGEVNAAMSDLRGNDANSTAGAAVNGPAGAIFNDVGGNKILHSSSGVISAVTAAQYGTLGFTGGIVPKATVTHTPNTCYAVTGNLLATAQNICTFLNDQNYQLLNITAQSGGTTPANSACATPPVITLSDGTRTATMTMTTGKTQWNSGVDAVTNINQIFASGTTLTVSIGANTCATPPVNVGVSYVLQSALNQ